MLKVTVSVPAGLSFDVAEFARTFRSIADALDEAAEGKRLVAEASNPAGKAAFQMRAFDSLRKVSSLTGPIVTATDVLRLIASVLDWADVSPERVLQ